MKKWKKKEQDDAEDFGGDLVRGSGSQWDKPGDVRNNQFLIESKYTSNKSYSITLKKWDKVFKEALFSFLIPMMSVRIQDKDLVVLSKEDFLKILEVADLDQIHIT